MNIQPGEVGGFIFVIGLIVVLIATIGYIVDRLQDRETKTAVGWIIIGAMLSGLVLLRELLNTIDHSQ